MTRQQFHANGKLLLSGEYLVLHGALALALPTKLGQTLTVDPTPATTLRWEAYQPEGPWFSAEYDKNTLELARCDNPAKAETLTRILKAVQQRRPQAFQRACRFETHLQFHPDWGLGSSSTLLANLAHWAGIDPYQLLNDTFGGSGYDIACATANTPIFYQLQQGQRMVEQADFNPPFKENLFFVYSGHKQSSSKEVRLFNESFRKDEHLDELNYVSEIGRKLPELTDLREFMRCLDAHEAALSRCLRRFPVQLLFFLDFEGSVKSLGAWGGDFLLAATEWPYEKVKDYFQQKGLNTVLKYQDIIIES